MIAVQNLSCSRGGKPILSAVSCQAQAGAFTVLLGPNGAGKSTLLECLAGHLPFQSGTIHIDNTDLKDWKPLELAQRRAVMSQQSVLDFGFLVGDVVTFGRDPHGDGQSSEGRHIVRQCLQMVDATHLIDRPYTKLSGGERQRVQLARTLAQIWSPGVLTGRYVFLDEPTAAMDLAHQEQICAHAQALAKRGCCVVAVLHDLALAARFGDHFVLLDRGAVCASGDADLVLNKNTLEQVYRCPFAVELLPPPVGRIIVPLPSGSGSA